MSQYGDEVPPARPFEVGPPQSVPILYSQRTGLRSLGRTNSSLLRDQTRDMCCTAYGSQSGGLHRLLLIIPLSTGVCLALMSPINSALGQLLDSGTWPALLSYSISFVFLLIVCLTTHIFGQAAQMRRLRVLRKFIRRSPLNFMVLSGGILGLLPVLADTYAPKHIGVGMLSTGVVAGQTALSVVADRFGLFWRKPYHLPWPIWAGVGAVFAGALIYRADAIAEFKSGSNPTTQLLFAGLAVLSGIARTSQTAVNRRLAPLLGRHRDALCLNYLLGSLVMLVIVPCVSSKPNFNTTDHTDIWKFSSGILSVLAQTFAIMSNKLMGFSRSVSWQVACQICCSTLLDHLGLLGLSKRPLSHFNVIGIIIVLLGVILTDMEIPHIIEDQVS